MSEGFYKQKYCKSPDLWVFFSSDCVFSSKLHACKMYQVQVMQGCTVPHWDAKKDECGR